MKDIFISMDDSGKLNNNEKYTVFAGVVFTSQKSRDIFINSYRKIIDQIKCKYCKQKRDSCDHNCPEVKSNKMSHHPSHRRRLMNLIEREYTYAVVIRNEKLYQYIMRDAASRGRYSDWAQKMIIKHVITDLIAKGVIKADDDIYLHLFLDEQPTITNGYYSLEESITEELTIGIKNFNYGRIFKRTLTGKFSISLKYRDSKYNYDVQAADIIAGTIHRILLDENIEQSDKIQKILKLADSYLTLP